jgi:hypothetical protein
MTAIKTEKAMTSNNIKPTPDQRESELNSAKSASLQFGLSVAVGVLIIVSATAAFYFGIIH